MDKKISELDLLTQSSDDDLGVIVDVDDSSGITKKVELVNQVPSFVLHAIQDLSKNMADANGDGKSISVDDMSTTNKYDSLLDYADSSVASGQKDVVVSDGSQFSVGEEVIIYDKVNTFESCVIESINSNTLTMTENLTNSYDECCAIGKYLGYLDTANQKYKRMAVPDLGDGSDGAFTSSGNETWDSEKNFTSVNIINGDIITIDGNIEIKCQGDFNITNGKITAKGKGHAGGGVDTFDGTQGTSQLGPGEQSTASNGGGGGGAGENSGRGSGGGGGGYGTNGSNGVYDDYGYGGVAYNTEQLSTFTLAYLKGSGGGGGGFNGGNGGSGGGIIRLSAKNFTVDPTNGEIDCDGNDGTDSGDTFRGGGGAGSGGTIFIQVLNKCSINTVKIHSLGGSGGLNGGATNRKGGDGGNGRIRIECSGKISGTSSPTFATGYGSNMSGYTKYGFYHTKKITPTSTKTVVQSSVSQKINPANLNASASSGQDNIFLDITSSTIDNFSVGNVCILTEGSKYEELTIDTINSTTGEISFSTNLENSYTTDAEIFRRYVSSYASLIDSGEDEDQQEMGLVDIRKISSTICEFNFQNTLRTPSPKNEIIGKVKITGKENNDEDIYITEADWFYY